MSARYWKRFPDSDQCRRVSLLSYQSLASGRNGIGGAAEPEVKPLEHGSSSAGWRGDDTLIVCLVSRYLLKGVYKNLNILVGTLFSVCDLRSLLPQPNCSDDRFFGNHEDDRGSRIFQSSRIMVLDRT